MLTALYSSLFNPARDRDLSYSVALVIGALVVLTLTLNTAGALGLGPAGVLPLLVVYTLAGLAGWFWFTASVNLVAQWFGGQGTGRTTAYVMAQGLLPLIFTAPAIAALNWSESFGALFTLAISISVLVLWGIGIQKIHQISWFEALLTLGITFALTGLALMGLIVWPLMLALGM